MKNDQKHSDDSTGNWLRQTLGDFQPDAPSNAWSRLEPNLRPKKERRPLVFGWWVAVGTAFFFALFWFVKKGADSSPVHIFKQKTVPEVAAALPGNSSLKFEKSNSENNVLSKKMPANAKTPQLQSGDILSEEEANFQTDKSTGTVFRQTIFEDEVLNPLSTPVKYFKKGESLETLRTRQLFAQSQNPDLQDLRIPNIENQPLASVSDSKRPKFWLQVQAAPMLYWQKHTTETFHGLTFPETTQKPGNGWQVGLSFAAEMRKNWRFALGIQYFQQVQTTSHIATLRLMDGICLNPNDPDVKKYEFQYAVISGGQRSDLTLRLEQEHTGSTMPKDEPFVLDMKTVRRSTAWRIPLSLERHFRFGGWQGFMRGGAVVDFSEKTSLEVTHYTEACQDLCFSTGLTPNIEVQPTGGAAIGWLVGAGIEREFFRRTRLRFEPFLIGEKHSWQGGLSVGLLFSN